MKCKLPNVEPAKFDFSKFDNHKYDWDLGFSIFKEFIDFYHIEHNEFYSEIKFFDKCYLNISTVSDGPLGEHISINVLWTYKDEISFIIFDQFCNLSLFIQFLFDFVRDNFDMIYKMRKELKKIGRKDKTDNS